MQEQESASTPIPRSDSGRKSIPAQAGGSQTAVPWPTYGVTSGVIGASLVALLLLAVDVLTGRPFWTPAALGSALFTGDILVAAEFDAWARREVIAGYTAIHLAIYTGYGVCAAAILMTSRRLPDSVPVMAGFTAGLLFVLFELTFLAQAVLFHPALAEALATGWLTAAQALAAGTMGFFLARNAGPRAPRTRQLLPRH